MQMEESIQHYMNVGSGQLRFPKILVMVLSNERLYDRHKQLYKMLQIPSQIVLVKNAIKPNLSKASNIIKQMNSKMGGDLFYLKLPDKLKSLRTMLVGIDVCHAGVNSIVGFAATVNRELSQYYSQSIVQQKGQEVVQGQMRQVIKDAMAVFAQNHKNSLPTNIIIYRDGVSAAERS